MVSEVTGSMAWNDYLSSEVLLNFMDDYQPWFCSVFASIAIGLSGVLPVLVVRPLGTSASKLKSKDSRSTAGGVPAKTLRLLLSFAVGGLLGDVFLHLLPEAYHHISTIEDPQYRSSCHVTIGLWVLAGVFTFIVVEMMFDREIEKNQKNSSSNMKSCHYDTSHSPANGHTITDKLSKSSNNFKNGASRNCSIGCGSSVPVMSNGVSANGSHHSRNGHVRHNGLHNNSCDSKSESRSVTGYLNLLANGIDNFAHGLAVAGSFLVSFKVGLLTTFAILIHEIPHEIGDFAILLRSGFTRLEAVRAQLATATVGLAGAIAALSVESAQTLGERTAWILPFTAGGFLHIALVNVLPDLLQEKDPRESIKQVVCLLAGVGVMAAVTIVCGDHE